ncbi:MAG TPA: SUMF1/EgtB/PvdO family nonheme iron enzyme [Phycisphaerae bacterium]|nr:SUMF1/EgtB/PvdO family nonheme iron enzyme [Phycisphaerae bacterium]
MISARGVARAAVVAAMVLLPAWAVQAITIDTVTVGNPGNVADDTGYGSVPYTYNIGTYEVMAGQYTAFLNAVAGMDIYALYDADMSRTDRGSGITRSGGGTVVNPYTYTVDANFVNRPVNYVSWGDAARFANWLHNGQPTGAQSAGTTEDGAYFLDGATSKTALLAVTREADWKWAITSEDEWYKAAYYDPATGTYFEYPTSSNTAPGQDMTDVSGNNANYWTAPYVYPIDSGKYTTVAGEFQNSDSPYGTFDQGGNVWEWNESILYGSNRGLRGGSFKDGDGYLQAAGWFAYDPTNWTGGIGFRVSEVIPEPVTMAGMVLGIGGLVGYVRRRMAR